MRTILAGLIAIAATGALADFDIEFDAADLRQMSGRHVIADLTVGESGLLAYGPLCRDGRSLYVWAMRPLDDEIYSDGFKVRREPGGRVSLEVRQDGSSKTVKQFLLEALAGAADCNTTEPYGPERFQVISINGAGTLSGALGAGD